MTKSTQPSLCLTVTSGPHAGDVVQSTGPSLRAGRSADNELCLADDTTISAAHAQFTFSDGHWYVTDSNSRNGVYIEEQQGLRRIAAPAALSEGCRIHLGSAQIVVDFRQSELPAIEPAVPRSERGRTTLQIRYEPGKISFGIANAGPLSRLYTTAYTPAWAEGAARRLEEVMQLANLGPDHGVRALTALENLGEQLARQLVPEAVLERLSDLENGTLLITHDSELLPVPWEWIRHRGTAWCEKFDLGRQVALEHDSIRLPETIPKARPSFLIVVNPTCDLPEAQAEGEALLRSLAPYESWLDMVFLSGSRVTSERLLAEMEQADLMYYLGHGQYIADRPDESGWVLHDGPLGMGQLQKLRHPPRVIVANACDSAREGAQSKGACAYDQNVGMASRFLLAGVDAYVGALWPIHAAAAAQFGRTFLQRYLGGAPIGSAVRAARLEMRDSLGHTDLAWVSYILYGDPLCAMTQPGQ